MNSKAQQKRFKRIKWTIQIVKEMQLQMQTIQLIFFLTDVMSLSPELQETKLELIVVASIYFILKLQGDITKGIYEFNDFVKHQLKFEKSQLLKTELMILQIVPDYFAGLLTFSECLIDYFPQLQLTDKEESHFLLKSTELICGFYLFGGTSFDLHQTICLSIKFLIETKDFPNIVNKYCDVLLKIISISFNKKLVNYFEIFIAEENPYVQMIFQSSFKR